MITIDRHAYMYVQTDTCIHTDSHPHAHRHFFVHWPLSARAFHIYWIEIFTNNKAFSPLHNNIGQNEQINVVIRWYFVRLTKTRFRYVPGRFLHLFCSWHSLAILQRTCWVYTYHTIHWPVQIIGLKSYACRFLKGLIINPQNEHIKINILGIFV